TEESADRPAETDGQDPADGPVDGEERLTWPAAPKGIEPRHEAALCARAMRMTTMIVQRIGCSTLRDVRQRHLPAGVGLLEVNRAAPVERPEPADVLVEADRCLGRTRGGVRDEVLAPHVADGRVTVVRVFLAPSREVILRGAAGGRIADVGLAPAPRNHT